MNNVRQLSKCVQIVYRIVISVGCTAMLYGFESCVTMYSLSDD